MARNGNGNGKTKARRVAEQVALAVGAGRPVAVETVDFSDPNRPKTCLEVDFPILPVNQVAVIEGNAGKPIYQMSKWWARRRSSVFRATLLAAAMKAPDDPAEAAKAVWGVYYANHQQKGALSHLKVADIFMGGGTTIVEGSRLGMQMIGNDLNPVAWFIVKNELAQVKREEVEAILADIEAEVKPQIMPFYACDCPRGHRGKWTRKPTGKVMGADFDPLALTPEERPDYSYAGPEMIYVFWAKHGPCQVTGCGHRTPIMSSPVVAVKELTVKAWEHRCRSCGESFDIEEKDARMAPGVPLRVADTEAPFAVLGERGIVACPHCGAEDAPPAINGKGKRKKVSLSLLVHPQWMAGEAGVAPDGKPYGGSVTDTPEDTARWNRARAERIRLVEVRGELPVEVACPETGVTFSTSKGTVPKSGHFACGACGTVQAIVTALEASGKTAPVAAFVVQGYCPRCDADGVAYGGRFFSAMEDADACNAADREWALRKDEDLAGFWPRSKIPFGHMTHQRQPLPQHGYLRWADMFNCRQKLVHALLLRAISEACLWDTSAGLYVMGAFQQYLRNQNSLCFWHMSHDHFAPALSNGNFHPKGTVIEVGGFAPVGYGPWPSTTTGLLEAADWLDSPWDIASNSCAAHVRPELACDVSGKSGKVYSTERAQSSFLTCASSTDLATIPTASLDLVITDPPFGDNVHYSELSDFFYVWLRLALKDRYPEIFGPEYTPKTLEAVSNRARHPEDPDGYYQRLLTACWREAHRILKPGGLLAFTFHHSEDAPWVAVLESLFEAGFYLEATYPIRSDETKGEGEFGSKKIEYDILHVCRKRAEDPTPTSWARMRRQVLAEVRQLKGLLEHHRESGLPEADLQVIRRGKALEYYSRHYGRVFVDEGQPLSVLDALVGINQILDEEASAVLDPPPPSAHPTTRQFLRLFDRTSELPRDQMQKFLKGTGLAPSDFVARKWCHEEKKVFHLTPPMDIARAWHGKHHNTMLSDYDQAMFLIGASFEDSDISAMDTLSNPSFMPHPALAKILEWYATHGADTQTEAAARQASGVLATWDKKNREKAEHQELLFGDDYVAV